MTHTASPRAGRSDRTTRTGVARFFRNKKGSVAIEFGMLALPFALLIFAILETCISFAGQQVLANSADMVARQLRTGQIKAADLTEAELREMICDSLDVIVSRGCPGLMVDLRQYDTFEDAAEEGFKIENKKLVATLDFDPGKSMTKNMLRVFYAWPVMVDVMRGYMASLEGGKTLHFASVTWQNEPFDD
jgi:hypothetical protein